MMRLDKYLAEMGVGTRQEVKRQIRQGKVTVNGTVVKAADTKIDETCDEVTIGGRNISYVSYEYYMLNKPGGVVSATEDRRDTTVIDLIKDKKRKDLFPVGRLDKDTEGLLLITNDGDLAHRLLAPKSHVTKRYGFRVEKELSPEDICALEGGVDIGGYVTAPCRVTLRAPQAGEIAITEGKYHQIKRMMEAVGNRITELERLSFGALVLEPAMKRGDWRELTGDEIKALQNGQPITKQERTERT